MTCRTGLGLLVLTAGLTLSGFAAAEDVGSSPDGSSTEKQKAKTGDSADKKDEKAKSGDATKADEAKGDAPKADAKAKKGDDKEGEPKQVAQMQSQGNSQNNGQASADVVTPKKDVKAPPRVPWRGTAVSWNHSATTSLLGVGEDFQSDTHQQYVQTVGANFNYFLVDEDKWRLRISTAPSFSVELTDSNVTTTRNEPWMNDLPLTAAVGTTWFSDKEANYAIGGVFNLTHLLPINPISQANDTIVTMSPRFLHWHSVPLIPKDVSPVFNSVFVGASIRWDHRFATSNTATFGPANAPPNRQDNVGANQVMDGSDVPVTGAGVARDTLRQGFFLFFQEALGSTTFQWFVAWNMAQQYSPLDTGPNDDCVARGLTGCVDGASTSNADVIGENNRWNFLYGFSAGASFFPMSEWGISAGYSNSGLQLGPDGRRRSVFYSPNATFSAGLVVSLDAIYERVTGEERNGPMVIMGKNETKKPTKKRKRSGPVNPLTF